MSVIVKNFICPGLILVYEWCGLSGEVLWAGLQENTLRDSDVEMKRQKSKMQSLPWTATQGPCKGTVYPTAKPAAQHGPTQEWCNSGANGVEFVPFPLPTETERERDPSPTDAALNSSWLAYSWVEEKYCLCLHLLSPDPHLSAFCGFPFLPPHLPSPCGSLGMELLPAPWGRETSLSCSTRTSRIPLGPWQVSKKNCEMTKERAQLKRPKVARRPGTQEEGRRM